MTERLNEKVYINGLVINKISNEYTEYYKIQFQGKEKILSKYERLESIYELLKEMIKIG